MCIRDRVQGAPSNAPSATGRVAASAPPHLRSVAMAAVAESSAVATREHHAAFWRSAVRALAAFSVGVGGEGGPAQLGLPCGGPVRQ
eukprot:3578957-Alexandrium_andersonii.AAC.1